VTRKTFAVKSAEITENDKASSSTGMKRARENERSVSMATRMLFQRIERGQKVVSGKRLAQS
jgi:hypothetical protein